MCSNESVGRNLHPKGGGVSSARYPSGSQIAFTHLEDVSMTHRVRGALKRFLALGALSVFALLFTATPSAAQSQTGKIQGTVTNQAGEAVAKAQVIIVGTAFGAVTDDKGYYFINNVPPGTYTFRAQFIGYAPTEIPGVRVLGGQTITQNFPMKPSAVVVGGINVVAAANPIVPRDQVTSSRSSRSRRSRV